MAIKRLTLPLLVLFISLSVISCKPACPIMQCQVRMVHPHGQGEFRGQPFWKKQNPRIGEKLPKQKKDKQKKNEKDKSKNKD